MAAHSVTILWLGDEAFVFDQETTQPIPLPEKGDFIAAISKHVAELEPKPALAQLVYQPSGLDPLKVPAVRGSRSVVAKALATDHPGINNPNTSWAMLTPLPADGSYSSHLFIEPRSKIQRLASSLDEEGIHLRGAWPLSALFDLLPEFTRSDALGLTTVNTTSVAAIYARQRDATRFFELLHNVSAVDSFKPIVNRALSPFTRDEPVPVLQFSYGDSWQLGETAEEVGNIEIRSIDDLLVHATNLPVRAPSNFLPPVTTLPWNRITQLAASLMLIGAVALGALYWLDSVKLEKDVLRRSSVSDDLRAEIAKLNENRDAITRNRAFASEVINDSAKLAALLEALVANVPTEITIHSLVTTEAGFTLSGTIHDGMGSEDNPFTRFAAALSRPENPWTLDASPPSGPASPTFTITGRFGASSSPSLPN